MNRMKAENLGQKIVVRQVMTIDQIRTHFLPQIFCLSARSGPADPGRLFKAIWAIPGVRTAGHEIFSGFLPDF